MDTKLLRDYYQLAQTLGQREQFETECHQADQSAGRAHDEHIRTHLRFTFEKSVKQLEQKIDQQKAELDNQPQREQELSLER